MKDKKVRALCLNRIIVMLLVSALLTGPLMIPPVSAFGTDIIQDPAPGQTDDPVPGQTTGPRKQRARSYRPRSRKSPY